MNARRKMTPRGQMSSNGSGPAIMMMPPNIREAFMPDPPLKHLPPPKRKRPKSYTGQGEIKPKTGLVGVATYMAQFERGQAPKKGEHMTHKKIKEVKEKRKKEKWTQENAPLVEQYKKDQRESSGEYLNMNCYNTLFVARLAYEVTERKLLREFETYGPIKDIKLVTAKDEKRHGKSKGYAFVEFEQEDDMKRAYRAADGIKIEGKHIVVDVERGHTVPNWLPRRLGGGLGATRLGGKEKNVTRPGRFDPSRPNLPPTSSIPPQGYGGRDGGYNDGGGYNRDPYPPRGGYGYDRPPPGYGGRDGGGGNHGGGNHGGSGYDRDRYGGPPRGGGYDGRGGGQQDRPPSGYDRGMKRERERHDDRGGGGGHYSRRRY